MRTFLYVVITLAFIALVIMTARASDFAPISADKKLAIRDAQVRLLSLQVQYAKLPEQIQEASKAYATLVNAEKPKDCTNCSFDEQSVQWVK